jgi:hypothetical protein
MAQVAHFTGDIRVDGSVEAANGISTVATGAISNAQVNSSAGIARTKLALDDLKPFVVNLMDFRVWDALQTNLPGTSANDDLSIATGTFGTNAPSLQTSDLKAAGATTRYARAMVALPAEYAAGETVAIVLHTGMITTVSDTTATVDVEAYSSDKDNTVSAELVTTSAQDINSLTFASDSFVITPTALVPGSFLDIRLTLAVNDAATGTAVIACIASVELHCDIRG